MEAKLRDQLDAVAVTVEDVSGGCGAMYKAYVESPKFVGLNIVKQHKLVQGVLKDEIAEMHDHAQDGEAPDLVGAFVIPPKGIRDRRQGRQHGKSSGGAGVDRSACW